MLFNKLEVSTGKMLCKILTVQTKAKGLHNQD